MDGANVAYAWLQVAQLAGGPLQEGARGNEGSLLPLGEGQVEGATKWIKKKYKPKVSFSKIMNTSFEGWQKRLKKASKKNKGKRNLYLAVGVVIIILGIGGGLLANHFMSD